MKRGLNRFHGISLRDRWRALQLRRIVTRWTRWVDYFLLGFLSAGIAAQDEGAPLVLGSTQNADPRIDLKVREAMVSTIEESRLTDAVRAMPELANNIDRVRQTWIEQLRACQDALSLTVAVERGASALWRDHRRAVQAQDPFDDRPLYWQRLAIAPLVRGRASALGLTSVEQVALIQSFDQASRGQADVRWDTLAVQKVLITGFDPFSLDEGVDQSNPSGLIALALDGQRFEVAGRLVEINAALFPVRYDDFDADVLENWLGPIIESTALSLFASISMGRDQFDLERFPGRRRSSAALGNMREHTGGSQSSPKPPLYQGKAIDGPEFVEFSLPTAAMRRASGAYEVRDNRTITTLERGSFSARSLSELQGQTAVSGSGGGYLSNEISYRSIRLARSMGVDLAMGHIHTPRIKGHDPRRSAQMLQQVRAMIVSALEGS